MYFPKIMRESREYTSLCAWLKVCFNFSSSAIVFHQSRDYSQIPALLQVDALSRIWHDRYHKYYHWMMLKKQVKIMGDLLYKYLSVQSQQ